MTLSKEIEKNLCFKGIVVPSVWDEKGNPVGFDLSTYNEEHYRLKTGISRINIAPFIHEQVEVIGRLQLGSAQITITIHQITKCLRDHPGN